MSAAENKAIYRSFVDNVLNARSFDQANEYYHADFQDHHVPAGFPAGLEGTKRMLNMMFAGFPDLEHHIEDLIAEDDKVVARLRITGTNSGPILIFPPTGKSVSFGAVAVYRFVDGKIAELWGQIDIFGLLQQLGVAPSLPI